MQDPLASDKVSDFMGQSTERDDGSEHDQQEYKKKYVHQAVSDLLLLVFFAALYARLSTVLGAR
jgi:hypothetical protein